MAIGENPFTSVPMSSYGAMMNPLRQMAPLRAASYMARMGHLPIDSQPRVRGAVNPSSFEYTDPNVFMNPDFQHQANAALSQYGLQLPDHIDQNAILPNSGFFGNHPRLSNALEAGMFAAANIHSGETTGDNISNVFQGMLAGRSMRAQAQAAPFTSSLNLAGGLEHLRDMQDSHNLNQAMINFHSAQAQRMQDRTDVDYDKIAATAPRPVEGGAWLFDQGSNKWNFQEGPGGKAAREASSAGMRAFEAEYGKEPAEGQINERGFNRAQWGHKYNAMQFSLRAAGPMAPYNNGARDPDQLKRTLDTGTKDMSSLLWDEKGKPSYYLGLGVKDFTQGPLQAKSHNEQIRNAHAQWEDSVRNGQTSRPFIDWYRSQPGNPNAGPSGNPLDRLMQRMDESDKAASTPKTPTPQPNHFLPTAPARSNPASPVSSVPTPTPQPASQPLQAQVDAREQKAHEDMWRLFNLLNNANSNSGIAPNTDSGNQFKVF